MLPRLQAEAQIAAVQAASLGSGRVKKDDARKALRALERAATGGRRKLPAATPGQLQAMGIGVHIVPASSGGAEVEHG